MSLFVTSLFATADLAPGSGNPPSRPLHRPDTDRPTRDTERLRRLVADLVASPDRWQHELDRLPLGSRVRLSLNGFGEADDAEAWLVGWGTTVGGQLHDHGASEAAFATVSGCLTELRPDQGRLIPRQFRPGLVRTVLPGVIHDVRNEHSQPAVSLHVYAPVVEVTTWYHWRDGQARHDRTEITPR